MNHDSTKDITDAYLLDLQKWIEQDSNLPYQGCVINHYENGLEFISPHSDNQSQLVTNSPIYSLSCGQARMFHIRLKCCLKKTHPDVKMIGLMLHDGLLMAMGGSMQKYYNHSVPIRGLTVCPDARISITFRSFDPNKIEAVKSKQADLVIRAAHKSTASQCEQLKKNGCRCKKNSKPGSNFCAQHLILLNKNK